ncbi:hypothetical protein FHW69_003721 [Luteibacter sp. Sphag1AF]|uniref:hypothetical protein n=1 Tax=Luteibacter sp. Sphag1AF TaxID=2587031 RepID=UPI00160E40B4|nr:hypothetical protein [Luteibacter sp. Sphag1AF]MBB3229072.1 hypothetical protein [Luteibacter sp. Sphag1AF]
MVGEAIEWMDEAEGPGKLESKAATAKYSRTAFHDARGHIARSYMLNFQKQVVFAFSLILIFSSAMVFAQPPPSGGGGAVKALASPQLPPWSADQVIEKKDYVFCSESDCYLTAEQFRALGNALKLYKKDMPQVTPTCLLVRIQDGLISTTLFSARARPSDFGYADGAMDITYLFDATGVHMVKRIYNRLAGHHRQAGVQRSASGVMGGRELNGSRACGTDG